MSQQPRDRIAAAFERELARSPVPQDLRAQAVAQTMRKRSEGNGRRQPWLLGLVAALLALAIVVTLMFTAQRLHPRAYVPAIPPTQVGTHNVSVCSTSEFTTCGFAGQPLFVSANVGWLTENFIDTSGPLCHPVCPRLVLFRTDDGGGHWSAQLGLPAYPQQILASPDSREVLVVPQGNLGASLFHSTDGGAHWASFVIPAAPVAPASEGILIHFLNPREGWVLSTEATLKDADLFHTVDAGANWSRTRIDIQAAFNLDLSQGSTNSSCRVDYSLHGQLVFRDSATAWFMPQIGISESEGGCSPEFGWDMYTTHDGGRTWSVQPLPRPIGLRPGATEVIDSVRLASNDADGALSLRVYAPGGGSQPDPRPYVYTTSDGGDHWSNPTQVPGSGSLIVQIDFIDARHWVGWVSSGGLMRTSDAGQHWDLLPAASISGIVWAQFLDPSRGWAFIEVSGGFSLVRTTDGGAHWTRLTVPEMGCSSCRPPQQLPVPSGSPVPSQLLGDWILPPAAAAAALRASGKGTCPTPVTAATCTIRLQLSATQYFWPNSVPVQLGKGLVVVNGSEIDFADETDCGLGDMKSNGRYRWTLTDGVLHFTSIDRDPCPRSAFLNNQSYIRAS